MRKEVKDAKAVDTSRRDAKKKLSLRIQFLLILLVLLLLWVIGKGLIHIVNIASSTL
jgi:hypothetical protein